MGICDFNNCNTNTMHMGNMGMCGNNNPREECIIAHKVFDQCRSQICITPKMLGPARASNCSTNCGDFVHEGETICPPSNAATVSVENFKLCRVVVVSKCPSPFRIGFWDIDIKFVFSYALIFRTSDLCEICCITATSIYTMKVSLFGSLGSDIVVESDLYNSTCPNAGPFVSIEAKAVALAAALRYPSDNACICNCNCNSNCSSCGGRGCNDCRNCLPGNCNCNKSSTSPTAVDITIGLFSIIKLFRLVNLTVQSNGYCMPDECIETDSENACDFFDGLDFPFNIFAPPEYHDLMRDRGKHSHNQNCGC